jgi:NAD(P)-dependent dehydrogenase (short-subunit alcohol dehydrogenase family)
MGTFEGRTALVTGSTQGVGRAVALRLACEGAAGIVVCGRDERRGAEVVGRLHELGTEASFVRVDLEQPDSCRTLVAAAEAELGHLDALVNAAGSTRRGDILDTDVQLFDELMAVNARAPLLLMQDAIRGMIRRGTRGSIVNVASVASDGSVPRLLPYAASKAALVSMSRNIAYAVAWHRIRVNVVRPGWIDTPGEDAIQRRYHGAGDGWREEAAAAQPFGRLIDPNELAGLVAYLVSPASGLMTGAVVDFDQSVMGAGAQPVPTWDETPR